MYTAHVTFTLCSYAPPIWHLLVLIGFMGVVRRRKEAVQGRLLVLLDDCSDGSLGVTGSSCSAVDAICTTIGSGSGSGGGGGS